MARATALKSAPTPAPGFEDKIRDARYQVAADKFLVIFDSGKEYSFARSLLDCDDGSEVVSVKVDAKRFYFRVAQASGNSYEVPWDRVLYEAEASYPYYRKSVARVESAKSVAWKIGKLRKARGLTQSDLARAANMLRPNLSRIEAGKHRATLETLEKLAAALKIPVADLIADR